MPELSSAPLVRAGPLWPVQQASFEAYVEQAPVPTLSRAVVSLAGSQSKDFMALSVDALGTKITSICHKA